jgi:hypothetical protein
MGDRSKGIMYVTWFITFLLTFIALTFTIRTASIGAIVLCAIAALFIFLGWYPLTWTFLSVAIIVAIASFLKGKSEE